MFGNILIYKKRGSMNKVIILCAVAMFGCGSSTTFGTGDDFADAGDDSGPLYQGVGERTGGSNVCPPPITMECPGQTACECSVVTEFVSRACGGLWVCPAVSCTGDCDGTEQGLLVSDSTCTKVPSAYRRGNNGHGNNLDGVDISNPGHGSGGPNSEEDTSAPSDDEAK